MKFLHCIKNEFLEFRRSRWLAISFLLCIGYAVWNILTYGDSKDILTITYSTQYFQILSMLLMGFVGVHLSSKEHDLCMTDVVDSIPNAAYRKQIAKLVCGMAICIVYFLLYFLALIPVFLQKGASPLLICHCISFLCLYGFGPSIVIMILGLCIGMRFRTIARYALLLCAWIMISPISSTFAQAIASIISLPADRIVTEWYLYIFHILSLGTPISLDAAPAYGLIIETPFIIRLAILFGVSLIIWIGICFMHRKSKRLFAAVVAAIVCAFLILSGSQKDLREYFVYYAYPFTGGASFEQYRSDMYSTSSNGVYLKDNAIPTMNNTVYITPTSYDVVLSLGMVDMFVECDVAVTVNETTDSQVFTLYSGFDVSDILVNGIKAKYDRQGDYCTVYLPEEQDAGQQVNITFRYGGFSSPLYPANRSRISLLSNYPWLPRVGMITPPQMGGVSGVREAVLFTPWIDDTEIMYTLHCNTDMDIYTNLSDTSDPAVYSGKSRYGLSICAHPLMQICESDGLTIYYPESASVYRDDLVQKAQEYRSARGSAFHKLDLPVYGEQSDKIVFLVSSAYHYNYATFSQFLNEDTTLFFDNATSIQAELTADSAISPTYGFTSCSMPYLLASCEKPENMLMCGAIPLWLYTHDASSIDPYSEWISVDLMFLGKAVDVADSLQKRIADILTSDNAETGRQFLQRYYSDLYRGIYWSSDDFETEMAKAEGTL